MFIGVTSHKKAFDVYSWFFFPLFNKDIEFEVI